MNTLTKKLAYTAIIVLLIIASLPIVGIVSYLLSYLINHADSHSHEYLIGAAFCLAFAFPLWMIASLCVYKTKLWFPTWVFKSSVVIAYSTAAATALMILAPMVMYSLEDNVSVYSESFHIDDKAMQAQLAQKLKDNQVEFQIGKRGEVRYKPEDGETVRDFAFEVMGRE